MSKIKCANCNKVLMEGKVGEGGELEKICEGCGKTNVITDKGVTIKIENEKPFQERLKMERK